MAEKRSKIGSICAVQSAKGKTVKLASVEIFPATEWEDGMPGQYRLRIDRSWAQPEGYRYVDANGVGRILASYISKMEGSEPEQLPRHKVSFMEPCWLPYGPVDEKTGMQLKSCQARVVSEDSVIGHDGRQYVAISAVELGGVRIMPVDDLRFYEKKRDAVCHSAP